jgi:nitroimidazol reductase NimA-like FMN-containing flavoprotein (pyridoxamine 5'-phosphate oxidase superfamily)
MPHGSFTNLNQIETVIRSAVYLQLALSVDGQPYVVPLNFGYADGVFYVHSKPFGKKLEWLARNPRVAFSLQSGVEPLHDAVKAENCTMRYLSVIGEGRAELVQDLAEKRKALDSICAQYQLQPYAYEIPLLEKIAIIKITPDTISGKWGNLDFEQYLTTNQQI